MDEATGIELHGLTVGELGTNCWVVDNRRGECLVVDPAGEAERLDAWLGERGLTVLAYLCTHGHVDHLTGLADLHARRPAPIGMHPADARWAFLPVNSFPPFLPAPRDPGAIERELTEGSTWEDGGLRYQVLETPGHTPGSVCLLFAADRVLITGDTLFAGGMGRVDLPGGDEAAMRSSLARLGTLDPELTIYPGHGPTSTIGQEREFGACGAFGAG